MYFGYLSVVLNSNVENFRELHTLLLSAKSKSRFAIQRLTSGLTCILSQRSSPISTKSRSYDRAST
jgi:hypothetical protein